MTSILDQICLWPFDGGCEKSTYEEKRERMEKL